MREVDNYPAFLIGNKQGISEVFPTIVIISNLSRVCVCITPHQTN